MAELAKQLPGWGGIGIDLPVFDGTGLKGAYDINPDVGFARREPGPTGSDTADPSLTTFR